MRFAIDGSVALRQLGGISEYTYRLLEALGTIPTNGHEFFVLTVGRNQGALGELPSLPENFHRVHRAWPQRLLNWTWRIFDAPPVDRWLPPFDLFFAPHFLVPAGRFPRLVVTIHDIIFLNHPEWFTSGDVAYFGQQFRSTLKRADHFITISAATKTDLIEQGVAAENITVTPLGVDYRPPSPAERQQARNRYHLPDRYLLYLGTLEPRKNLVRLVNAYRRLTEKRADLPPLILAGRRGWIGSGFDATLAATPNVRLTGTFTRADRSVLLAGAEALLFPSLAEGFGLPVLEGMAAGVPVLTSNTSSLPEVAGEAALLVDPYDEEAMAAGIERLLEDNDLRRQLIAAGRVRAKKFTWQHTAVATLKAWEGVR